MGHLPHGGGWAWTVGTFSKIMNINPFFVKYALGKTACCVMISGIGKMFRCSSKSFGIAPTVLTTSGTILAFFCHSYTLFQFALTVFVFGDAFLFFLKM